MTTPTPYDFRLSTFDFRLSTFDYDCRSLSLPGKGGWLFLRKNLKENPEKVLGLGVPGRFRAGVGVVRVSSYYKEATRSG